MIDTINNTANDAVSQLENKYGHQPEFLQAVHEIYDSIKVVLDKNEAYRKAKILDRIFEPERLISFRVTWVDDQGEIQVNRGFRVQMNSALGPYKGGLRFHPTVNEGILKFLATEQIFKNALTTLPMGAGKGGSDFDPKGKSDAEVMRFCQAFMLELYRHVGHRIDVPAGDIGVGGREIGYLYGMYKKVTNRSEGVLTGKGVGWGGSLIRTEATGYGAVYFAANMLEAKGQSLEGKTCIVSGSGNVAQYAIEKLLQLGAKVVAASDSSGFIYDEEGINEEKLEFIKELKNVKRGRIKEYAEAYPNAEYTAVDPNLDYNPIWQIKADCAFPSATQNELNAKDAVHLIANNIQLIAEGANMPLTIEAIEAVQDAGVLYAPGKAANAGGVAVSGLEMTQNYMGNFWTKEEVDQRLFKIMKAIHRQSMDAAAAYGKDHNYAFGANVAGFTKVADAMLALGIS
jgi:glutamate dehydrogenase (NADP+)